MNINQLKIKLKELETNLQNKTVQATLQGGGFSLEDFEESLQSYYKNIEQIQDDDLLKIIETKILELISYSNEPRFVSYSHKFINAANFLISNTPKEPKIEKNDISESTQILEKEFSKRYDKLIEALNFEGEECNLILETPSKEKKPFKVYKNQNKSIVVKTQGGTTNTRTKDKLIGIVYRNESDEKRSYDKVIIQKILDNSIFDFLVTSSMVKENSSDLLEAMKNKLSNNENELLKIKNKFEKIEKENQTIEEKKEQFYKIFEKSENLDIKIQALEDKIKLNASVTYWEAKQKNHKIKFWWFGGAAIVFIAILLLILFKALNYHENQINGSGKIEIISDINITNESNKAIQDVNKSISAIKQTLQEPKKIISNNEENSKSFDFDYSKLAWYILMIFASSSAFWIIRITVKIALSNLHLSEDAHERVVMIQTYLSFINEGQINNENAKNLILSSLFRPSNIGIIKDESSVTVADIMTTFKK